MRRAVYAGACMVVSLFGSVLGEASMDPLWLYKDLPDTELIFSSLLLFDTCRSMSINRIYPVDTGDAYEGKYINFDYQFSADTMKVIDPFDSATVMYSDYRPGYAGFKFDWDNGVTGFPLSRYRYLAFHHKGPLPNHKIIVRFGYNSGCGSPTTFNTLGTVDASDVWKRDSIRIPDSLLNLPDSVKKRMNYYEMQVLINNADPSDTNETSVPGNLKIDNIALADTGSGSGVRMDRKINRITREDMDRADETANGCGCGSGIGLALLPPLWFKSMAVRRRKKRNKQKTG
jgi:hypothetical protein